MYKIGVAKVNITAEVQNVGMMGYGNNQNIVKGVETPVFARAVVIESPNSRLRFAFVNAEICFISTGISRGVAKKLMEEHNHLGFNQRNILLSAQHTHSATGGYTHFPFFNITIPGYVPEVYKTYVNGIAEAIVQAANNLQLAEMRLTEGNFIPSKELAINRSVDAYNQNPENEPVDPAAPHLATDPSMHLLRIDDLEGNPIAMINWFGVHTTSISNDNQLINADNKGYASTYFEEYMQQQGHADFVAIFAQKSTGDVSPNAFWDEEKKWTRGKFKDDVKSAKHNGRLQFNKAKELFQKALKNKPLIESLDYRFQYVDFGNITVDTEFANGQSGMKTSRSCIGLAFFCGTKEGPGIPKFATHAILRPISKFVKAFEQLSCLLKGKNDSNKQHILNKYKAQANKEIIVETGDQRFLGISSLKTLARLVPPLDKDLKVIKKQAANNEGHSAYWTVQVLPLQILILGRFALVAVPCETTITAGKRLQKVVLDVLKARNIQEVLVAPYANAYCGYATTYEEYQLQCYEGGHTVFGQWTLAAFQTKYKELATNMVNDAFQVNTAFDIEPRDFSEEELNLRRYQG